MQSYVRTFLTTLGGALLLVVGFNWLMNPYGLFPAPAITGINAYKPELSRRQYVAYPYDVARVRPQVVILGTSRAMHIPTEQAAWSGQRSYNLALASSSFYEQFRLFQHAVAGGGVETVLWGVDLFAFVHQTHPDFSELRLRVDAQGQAQGFSPASYLRDAIPGLLSGDALRSSVKTLRRQNEVEDMGRRLHANKPVRIRSAGGQRRMFLRLEQGVVDLRPGESRLENMDLESFRQALRFAHARNIDLRLFISPEHARLLELWEALGRGDTIAKLKRELVRMNQEEAERSGRRPFPLWDFSGYNAITTEALPALGDTETHMHWYWEGSHYSEAAADLIVARVFEMPHSDLPADFGLRIEPENVEGHIANVRAARAAYRNAHPADIAELDTLLKRSGRVSTHQSATDREALI
jgi:hypothetical protein